MSISIGDLQLIYGVAGAREKFEKLTSELIQSEEGSARRVEAVQGDGGIDVYVGDWSNPIDVYQVKFFPIEIGDSQKDQIRKSFYRCREDKRFAAKSWTLCIPRDMTVDETAWFDVWSKRQEGIEIRIPWTATRLEFLLNQEANRGIKESYFRQEYLSQIRDIHKRFAEPNVLRAAINDVSVDTCQTFRGRVIAVIKLHLDIENTSIRAVSHWDIKRTFRATHIDQKVVTKEDFPGLHSGKSSIALDRTIVGGFHRPEIVTFGFLLRTEYAIDFQLYNGLRDIEVSLTAVSDNHAAEPVTFTLGDVIKERRLTREILEALERAGITGFR